MAESGSQGPRRAGHAPWAFVAIFAGLYCVLYIGYSAVPDTLLRERVYLHAIVRPAAWVINALAPDEHVEVYQNQLRSASERFNIVRGCDGAGFYFMLVAAIVACRRSLRATALGIVGACAIVYLVNEIRIIVLYFLVVHRPSFFLPAHVYFIPSMMILVSALYFARWTRAGRDVDAALAS